MVVRLLHDWGGVEQSLADTVRETNRYGEDSVAVRGIVSGMTKLNNFINDKRSLLSLLYII